MNKIYDAIMGLVVADALGVPVEFKPRGSFEVTDMIGYGTHNQPAGTWSDDSSMTLATVESITRLGKIDAEDIMKNFKKWILNAQFTPYKNVFDVGGTTSRAINRYMCGVPFDSCGGGNESDNGNGSLMRILPVALAADEDPLDMMVEVKVVSSLTHSHPIAVSGCWIYAALAKLLMKGMDKREAVFNAYHTVISTYGGLTDAIDRYRFIPEIGRYEPEEIRSTGYVVDTLEAAIWCLLNSSSYKDCVLLAVNLGEDTDTVAAVAGGLAGILYGCGGVEGIPERWIEKLARKDWVQKMCRDFENKLSK